MKARLIAASVLTILATLVTGVAMAWYASDTGVPNPGTLVITTPGTTGLPFDVSGMAPGDTVHGRFVVSNEGSAALSVHALITGESRGPADLAEVLDVCVRLCIGDEPYMVWQDSLKDLLGVPMGSEPGVLLLPGEFVTYEFTVCFRPGAGNEYQGSQWTGTICFGAY